MEVTSIQNITKYDVVATQIVNEYNVVATQETVNYSVEVFEMGMRGFSAYEIAVQNGFVGTIEDWQDSLKASIIIQDLPELP